jgi:ubiquinone biosynthesis protein Coq4
MDAISAGWTLGRNVANIQCEKWETMLDQPLAEVRARYGLTGSPSLRVAQAV